MTQKRKIQDLRAELIDMKQREEMRAERLQQYAEMQAKIKRDQKQVHPNPIDYLKNYKGETS